MLWLIICAFIVFFLFVYEAVVEDWGSAIMVLIFGSLISIIVVLFFGAIAGGIISSYVAPVDTVVSINEIVVLKEATDNKGPFYLGCGKQGEDSHYYFLEKTEFGVKLEKNYMGYTYINYTNDAPKVEVHELTFPYKWQRILGFDQYTDYIVISIPYDSVIDNFEVAFD